MLNHLFNKHLHTNKRFVAQVKQLTMPENENSLSEQSLFVQREETMNFHVQEDYVVLVEQMLTW